MPALRQLAYCQSCQWMLPLQASQFFWYLQWFHLWPLVNDAFLVYLHYLPSTSCIPTERNRVVSYQVTQHAKPLVNHRSSFLHAFCSKVLVPLCWNVAVLCHEVATFIHVGKRTSSNYSSKSSSRKFLSYRAVKYPLIAHWPVRLLPITPHHTSIKNYCWKWHCCT